MGATADLAGLYYTSKPDRPEYKMTQMNIIPQSTVFISPYSAQEHVLADWFYPTFLFFTRVAPQPKGLINISVTHYLDDVIEFVIAARFSF